MPRAPQFGAQSYLAGIANHRVYAFFGATSNSRKTDSADPRSELAWHPPAAGN
jgi:hypothetical protein